MDTLISLKSGIDALSMPEFINLIESHDIGFWSDIIFTHFLSQLQNPQNINKITEITNDIKCIDDTIDDIIRSREGDHDTNDTNDNNMNLIFNTNFQCLPNEMISHIGSFLDFNSMSNLQATSRTICIGNRQYFNHIANISDHHIFNTNLIEIKQINHFQIASTQQTFIPSINLLNHALINGMYSSHGSIKIDIICDDYKPIKRDPRQCLSLLFDLLSIHDIDFIFQCELMDFNIDSTRDLIDSLDNNFNVRSYCDWAKLGKRPKKPNDWPFAPMSPYFVYSQRRRPQLVAIFPYYTVSDISHIISNEWQSMTNLEMDRYREIAIEMKQEYKIKMERYKLTQNYINYMKELDQYPTNRIYKFIIKSKEMVLEHNDQHYT